jgi:large conductance mechanosensitive channel
LIEATMLRLSRRQPIVSSVLFLAIRALAKLQKAEAAKPAEPPKPSREVELLTEIRDLLKT